MPPLAVKFQVSTNVWAVTASPFVNLLPGLISSTYVVPSSGVDTDFSSGVGTVFIDVPSVSKVNRPVNTPCRMFAQYRS